MELKGKIMKNDKILDPLLYLLIIKLISYRFLQILLFTTSFFFLFWVSYFKFYILLALSSTLIAFCIQWLFTPSLIHQMLKHWSISYLVIFTSASFLPENDSFSNNIQAAVSGEYQCSGRGAYLCPIYTCNQKMQL